MHGLAYLGVLTALLATVQAGQIPSESQTFRVCRHTKYVAEGANIYAVDPTDASAKKQIFIKGVTWSGMELPKQGIPQGLWGDGLTQRDSGITGTSLAKTMQFMTNNSINVVRFPITATNVIDDTVPMVTYVHGENKEIALYPPGFTPKTSDFVARLIGAFQKYRIGIVLDIHTLTEQFADDAYWYYPKATKIEETKAYQAAVVLATNYCSEKFWNVLGLDIKNAMTDVTWAKSDKDADAKTDWATAASVIAAKVNSLCPQWLVFTTGASAAGADPFTIPSRTGEAFKYWAGGNFKNATTRPLTGATNVVYAPQAHTHGVLPQAYLYDPKANCTTGRAPAKEETECALFINGTKSANTKRSLSCQKSSFSCASYTPLAPATLAANYKAMLDSSMGDIVKEAKHPIVMGGFSAVYIPDSQPQQVAAFDILVKYIVENTSGGFYANLNPDMEMYLEAPPEGKTIVGKTRWGLMKTNSWQAANAELLQALSTMKSSEIPCFGDERPGNPDASSAMASAVSSAILVATLLASCLIL